MLRLASEPPGSKRAKMPENSRMLFGLAILLTLLSDGIMMNTQFTALSTVITANTDPTALQQLATFAAMEDVAEEEQLDWGSSGRLVRSQPNTMIKPRNAGTPDTEAMAAASPSHSRSSSRDTLSDGLSKSVSDAPSRSAGDASSAASSAASSRRRPHRRHRRRGGASSDTLSGSVTASESVEVSDYTPSQPVHSYPMWTQFHVMEVAYSTGSNNFVHLTERFLEYQQMFPTVYRCDLTKVSPTIEAELLASARTGLAASSHWSCEHCGRKHDVVREDCLRCHSPGPYAKLFVGQALKEMDCAESLIRFLHATHPEVTLHRVEGHHDTRAGGTGRGKGCAAVYVAREDAASLQAKLHHNAFFDVDDQTGKVVVYYVYPQQQEWLHSFVRLRCEQLDQRPLFLPLAPLVVEESVAAPPAAKRGSKGHGRPQDRGNVGLAPAPAVR